MPSASPAAPASRRVTAAVLLGLGLLTYHYLRLPALWHDEAALVLNVLHRDFRDYLGPLLYHEAAPPLFLALERLAFLAFGDSLYALRLLPFLSSCLALLLFARLARQWLPDTSAAWAVLLFACSDRFLWHACEAKPYAVDLLVATGVLALWTSSRDWPPARRLALYAPLAPLLIWLSYPACFVCGGLLVALLPEVWQARRAGLGVGYVLCGAAVVAAFLLLALGPVRAQRCPEMESCWTAMFPDWRRPWLVPVWAARATLGVLNYCCQPAGVALAVPAVAGAWHLLRRGEGAFLALLAAPPGLALVASLIGAYPYGGARVLFYAAPAALLLTGAGLAPLAAWLDGHLRWGRWALALALLCPPVNAGLRLAAPWKRAETPRAAAHVLAYRREGEAVLCNCWECFYHFRGVVPEARSLHDDGATAVPARAWVVVVGAEDARREEIVASLLRERALLERRDYRMVTVLLLTEPRGTSAAE